MRLRFALLAFFAALSWHQQAALAVSRGVLTPSAPTCVRIIDAYIIACRQVVATHAKRTLCTAIAALLAAQTCSDARLRAGRVTPSYRTYMSRSYRDCRSS
jgi:hypothetical protein